MNRYVAAGLLADAQAGKRVVYVGPAREGTELIRYAGQHADNQLVTRAVKAAGRERIDFNNGGTLLVKSTAALGLRGITADIIYLDHEAAHGDIHHLVATMSGPVEVIRA